MADPRTAATGAVMRPSVLRRYTLQAGFGDLQVLPIHTDYWRFYRLLGESDPGPSYAGSVWPDHSGALIRT
jgi:hypothetical protein